MKQLTAKQALKMVERWERVRLGLAHDNGRVPAEVAIALLNADRYLSRAECLLYDHANGRGR